MSTQRLIYFVIAFAVGFVVGWYVIGLQESVPQKVSLNLPTDASPVSPCFPGYGEHHSSPSAISESEKKVVTGPTYMVDSETGIVHGIEYHFSEEGIKDYTITERYPSDLDPIDRFSAAYDLFGVNYEYFTIKWSPGHPGFESQHVDVHVFTVTPEERLELCGGLEQ